jgi:hypothetical protein
MEEGVSVVDGGTNSFCIFVKLPGELIDYLNQLQATDPPEFTVNFDRNQHQATIVIDGKSYSFSSQEEERHECFHEEDNIWTKVGLIHEKFLTNLQEQELREADIAKFHESVMQAEKEGKKHRFASYFA